MTAPTPPTTPKDVKAAGSEYVMLEASAADQSWKDRGIVTARDAEHAVRKHASANGNAQSTFVAVPRKSWKPLTVKAETVTTLKLEEVKA